MQNISIKKASLINAVAKYSTVLLSIVFSAILSRILTPQDYGIVAIVTVFTLFFNVLADMGLGTAIIQRKDLSEEDTNHIFSFSIYIAIVLGVVFIGLSYPISIIYKNSVYISICTILSISVFFNTLNMIPNAVLLKQKRFILVGLRLIIVTLLTYGITIFLAYKGFKYYALVIQSVSAAFLTFIWNFKSVHLRPVLKINFATIKSISSYSGFQFAFNLITYFSRNLDKFIIGERLGDVQLGHYDKAYRFMLYPVQNLTHVITPALHPILSDYQDDKEYIYKQYIKILKFLSLLGILVSIVCIWNSKEIILLVFGDQWTETVRCFYFLSFSIWAQMVCSSTGSIYQSLGDTRRLFYSTIINTLLTTALIFVGLFIGRNIQTISLCVSVSYILHFFPAFYLLIKSSFKIRFLSFIKKMVPDFIIYFFMLLFVILIPIDFCYSNIINLLLKSVISFVLWLGLIIVFRQLKYLNIFKRKVN